MTDLRLEFGLKFEDLYSFAGLQKIDAEFTSYLEKGNVDLFNKLMSARTREKFDDKIASELLIDLAPYLEDFIAKLFGIRGELDKLIDSHNELGGIYSCKRLFVQRVAIKKYPENIAVGFDGKALREALEKLLGENFSEKAYADKVNYWLENKENNEDNIEIATKYAAWALVSEEGKKLHKKGVLFKVPHKLDFNNLVAVETQILDGVRVKKTEPMHVRQREGFSLTDKGVSLIKALDEANYCIYCHNQGKDSCSKGLKDKDSGEFKSTILDVKQAGCPLEEKISEMNNLKSRAVPLGALAVVTIDNPLCAATGHRICNDCMKSCIYQKQEPVNIPRVETRVLQDILDLPWGFEIYSLLTRWNPLNFIRPIPRKDSGYKVLVAGLGPAGFNLSHHLLNEGHLVVGIDGLKIEPLPDNLSGVRQDGGRVAFWPIFKIDEIFEDLDNRVLAGFGGVAEYGITVRWNKNYLKVIRLLLERRSNFIMHGGVRFGSTITYDSAFALGFDHIALAMGAGKPTLINMKNGLARGVRTASDFLMSLQLSGAAKKDSIANLQLRLPVVVIGGGLTAVDTATESLAYYPVQVEKFLKRYEKLCSSFGEAGVRSNWSDEEAEVADEFISHAKSIREELVRAAKDGRKADILRLLNEWGGVNVVYRKKLQDAPAYRLNHEEVELALEEGIGFIENATPLGVEIDKYQYAKGLTVKIDDNEEKILAAKTIFIAAGTNPNTVLAREDGEHFVMDGKYFRSIDEDGNIVKPESNSSKPKEVRILLNKNENNKFVSYFGDLHPSYVGNVVKAMGAAKQGYPIISNVLKKALPSSKEAYREFADKINNEFTATIHEINRLTPKIIEIVVKAPAAARNFKPGQFYRLQNYEANSVSVEIDGLKTTLATEGLALTGASVDKERGLLSTIVLEMGGSSDICAYFEIGEKVVLMGPTGTPTETPRGETVMLVGGGLGNAVLFSIGKALREAGSKVIYFAGYKKAEDRYKVEEIERAADQIIWACDESKFEPERSQDVSFHGNIVKAIEAYGEGLLGRQEIDLLDVDRIIVIGSDRMMAAVAYARHNQLKHLLKPKHEAIGSINSPMQCMMKEICAQCLQRHVNPVTGEESYVYSCFNQDQCLDSVDFGHLHQRLQQNNVQEKLTAKWIDYCLKHLNLRQKVS